MEREEFKKELLSKIESNSLNIKFNENQINQLFEYLKNIIEWNEKINVTAIVDEKMFIVKHFLDSFTVNGCLKEKFSLIDIGTGAGFPGVPIKILNPDSKVVLIDSVNKKLNVIRESTKDFEFDKFEIIHTRAEDLAFNNEYREKFDYVTTRAVSNLTTIAEYMLPFVKMNGYAICMKGPNYNEELEASYNAINILGGQVEKILTFKIDDELERNIVIIKKIRQTPSKYPRSGGKPLKEPIK